MDLKNTLFKKNRRLVEANNHVSYISQVKIKKEKIVTCRGSSGCLHSDVDESSLRMWGKRK